MTASEPIRQNDEYRADRGLVIHAATEEALNAMSNFMFIEIAQKIGWTKNGSLWVQPDKAKAWAWTDEQLIEHIKKSHG